MEPRTERAGRSGWTRSATRDSARWSESDPKFGIHKKFEGRLVFWWSNCVFLVTFHYPNHSDGDPSDRNPDFGSIAVSIPTNTRFGHQNPTVYTPIFPQILDFAQDLDRWASIVTYGPGPARPNRESSSGFRPESTDRITGSDSARKLKTRNGSEPSNENE